MKFTSIKTNKQQQMQLGVHDAEWFMQRITHETIDAYTTGFRKYLKSKSKIGEYKYINEIPRLCVAGEFKRTKYGEVYWVQDRIRA